MKRIHKLNELLLSESFVQVNYSKGFKYIDRAGEILNYYAQETASLSTKTATDTMTHEIAQETMKKTLSATNYEVEGTDNQTTGAS